MLGCTNPNAVNFNGAATKDDGSCIFLYKINGICYAFQAEPPLRDESFTLSWAINDGNWVFYHDYIPDFYFRVRKQLFSIKNKKIYRHNEGAPGKYYTSNPAGFFMDIVFAKAEDMILNTVEWISEVMNSSGAEQEFKTFTHITIWNNQQCTGKIPLSHVENIVKYGSSSKTQGFWSFEDFKDLVKTRDGDFLKDLFNNFAVKTEKLSHTSSRAWYNNALMEDRYFIIRLEYDNTDGNTVLLHGTSINENTSDR